VVDFLVQALGFADLRHGVFGEALPAELREKRPGLKLREQRVLVNPAVGRRAQELQHGGAVFQQQLHEAAQLVEHLVVGRVGYLRHVVQPKKLVLGQHEHALEVGIGVRQIGAVRPAAAHGFKEDKVLAAQVGDGHAKYWGSRKRNEE
jgi:hypothetical protein